jgi:hypothetical protein
MRTSQLIRKTASWLFVVTVEIRCAINPDSLVLDAPAAFFYDPFSKDGFQ